MASDISILALPHFDPSLGRIQLVSRSGTSIAEMIALVLPNVGETLRRRARVTIAGHLVPPDLWRVVRPKAGAAVIIRVVPGDDLLRSALTVAVTVAAIAAGQFYAPALLSALGVTATTTTTALASAAISGTTLLAGTLLINALIPPRSDAKDKPTYAIQGLKNQLTPDAPIPLILGFVRYAPPYAAIPYTQALGDNRFVVACFLCGYGPVAMRNWRIGQTPIERYADVTLETRAGYGSDEPLTLYSRQVIEEALSIELLTSVLPTGGPQIRVTAADCIGCEIDTTYPGGVFGQNKDGGYVPFTVLTTTRYRLAGSGDDAWVAGPTISVTGKKAKAITRTTPITFPVRGRYEVELTRATVDWDEADQSKKDIRRSGRSAWSTLRSFRPEYPIAFGKPLALAACLIRATGQLNGMLDELSADMASICPDWDAASGSWVIRETNNPASLFRYVLTGPAMTYPLTLDEVAALQDWHIFCAAKGLTYNRAHDYEASVLDVLSDVAAAGRASPQDSGTAWGVVVDRALQLVSAHITPRNSSDFKGERQFVVFPDAFRVSFFDETNSYARAERIVPWPGFQGEVRITEKLELPGITNPVLIWKETRRRQFELIRRRDTYTVVQDFEQLASMRGDLVQLNHDVLDRAQISGRVKAVVGTRLDLDEAVTFVAGRFYGCRFRREDGTSVMREVQGQGETKTLTLVGNGYVPAAGELVLFGSLTRESIACTVKGIEPIEDFGGRLTLVDHAPEIEAMVDAELPPAWSGRAGGDAQIVVGAPLVPLIVDVVSGRQASDVATADIPYPVVVLVQGDGLNTVPLGSFRARHRLGGASSWAVASGSVSSGAVLLRGYASGDQVEIQAAAVSDQGASSGWTTSVTHTVAATDPAAPAPPPGLSLATPASGTIRVSVTSSPSAKTAATQIFMATGADAPFASAIKVGAPISSGPNTALPPYDITGLNVGTTYRIWAVTLDAESPPNQSAPAGPASIFAT